ncbi:lens epithelial cell protein LEP503 [Nerophis lumbriciformis]|uniref:lens epithelial cell protein LEP503 n=1 Tax=Nerophis lumbriciformis TaxID=546530 RepID=UPI002ADF7D0A|nr:lens epithelial cell protein LEP503-like [Nerophis lumbriciformis]
MSPILPLLSHLASHFIGSLSPLLSGAMHPQRPLPQAVPAASSSSPSSLGQQLRDMAMGLGRGKNFLGGNVAYGFVQSLKECLYFLLCCWCIKEILD